MSSKSTGSSDFKGATMTTYRTTWISMGLATALLVAPIQTLGAAQAARTVAANDPVVSESVVVNEAVANDAVANEHAPRAATPRNSGAPVWDARAVEHLLNRASFGARQEEIDEGVKLGRDALVDQLLGVDEVIEPFFVERIDWLEPREKKEMAPEDREKIEKELRERDRKQLVDYTAWWYDRMMSGRSPTLERMVLFWHGFFATAIEPGHRSYETLKQNQVMREHALGSYAKLLRAITADPAMLQYLDNQVNRKGNPNENFARELMELFSLGEGNYTEQDVKEAARALTGRQERKGAYFFDKKSHDDTEKTILGQRGKFDGDDLVDILLKQPACARWVSRRIIEHFEGVEPSEQRVERYAALLRKSDYEIRPLLAALFRDPEFYRDEVVGVRVQGPVEYMVGLSHRLSFRVPPLVMGVSTTLLGQRLFAPPSVKGWEEGEAWITTATLMQRGNLAGLVLGVVTVDAVFSQKDLDDAAAASSDGSTMSGGTMTGGSTSAGGAADGGMQGGGSTEGGGGGPATERGRASESGAGTEAGRVTPPVAEGDTATPEKMSDKLRKAAGQAGSRAGAGAYRALKRLELSGWGPTINFTARMQRAGAKSDSELVDRMLDELLAIDAPEDTHQSLTEYLARERALLDVRDGSLFDAGAGAEKLLRRLAHLILSLPEAQLG
jgi:uncharacterized protein (DUF1800 family)